MCFKEGGHEVLLVRYPIQPSSLTYTTIKPSDPSRFWQRYIDMPPSAPFKWAHLYPTSNPPQTHLRENNRKQMGKQFKLQTETTKKDYIISDRLVAANVF